MALDGAWGCLHGMIQLESSGGRCTIGDVSYTSPIELFPYLTEGKPYLRIEITELGRNIERACDIALEKTRDLELIVSDAHEDGGRGRLAKTLEDWGVDIPHTRYGSRFFNLSADGIKFRELEWVQYGPGEGSLGWESQRNEDLIRNGKGDLNVLFVYSKNKNVKGYGKFVDACAALSKAQAARVSAEAAAELAAEAAAQKQLEENGREQDEVEEHPETAEDENTHTNSALPAADTPQQSPNSGRKRTASADLGCEQPPPKKQEREDSHDDLEQGIRQQYQANGDKAITAMKDISGMHSRVPTSNDFDDEEVEQVLREMMSSAQEGLEAISARKAMKQFM